MVKESKGTEKGGKVKVRTILLAVVTFIIGWITHIGYSAFDTYKNRPILSFEIKALTISQIIDGNSNLNILLRQENTGESEAMFTINGCVASFPHVSAKSLNIEVSEFFSLPPRTQKIDTVIIPLTFALKQMNINEFDTLDYIELSIEEKRLEKTYNPRRTGSEVKMQGGMSDGGPAKYSSTENMIAFKNEETGKWNIMNPDLVPYITLDPKTGKGLLVRGRHNILYEGVMYYNEFYPNTATVVHKIEDDKIIIECALELDTTGIPQPGFHFVPDPRIEDKIVLPNAYTITATMVDTTEEASFYNNLRMDLEQNDYGAVLFYLFE